MATDLPVYFVTASDGARIAYTVVPGKGPPFLFVASPGSPPIASRGNQAEHIWRPFCGDRMAVALEFRGGGQSDRRLPTSLNDLVLDLETVTNAVGDIPDVVTHTYGCFAGCAFAAAHPGRWRSLTLVDASVHPDNNVWAAQNRPGWKQHYLAHLSTITGLAFPELSPVERTEHAREWAAAVSPEAFEVYLAMNEDLSDILPRLTIPALVTSVTMKHPDGEVAALIPDSVLVEVEASERNDWRRLRELWDEHVGSRIGADPGTGAPDLSRERSALTTREEEVLRHLAASASSADIAAALGLSPRTIDRHLSNIYAKLGVHNRVAATNWARDNLA